MRLMIVEVHKVRKTKTAVFERFGRTEKTPSAMSIIKMSEPKPVDSALPELPGAGFMNRRRLCQLTAAILTSDLTTHNYVGFMKRHSNYLVTIQRRVGPIRWT